MKAIVIYYSYGGNTRRVAEKIGKSIGADLVEVKTVQPYTGSSLRMWTSKRGYRKLQVNKIFSSAIKRAGAPASF